MRNHKYYNDYYIDHKHFGDLSGEIRRTGSVVVDGSILKKGLVDNTGGVIVNGHLYGCIDTTGEVIVRGSVLKGAVVKNTGGGEVHGVLDGTFDTTGVVKVYGSIGPNALILGGKAVVYQKVKKLVTETYSVPATRLVEREIWEPL